MPIIIDGYRLSYPFAIVSVRFPAKESLPAKVRLPCLSRAFPLRRHSRPGPSSGLNGADRQFPMSIALGLTTQRLPARGHSAAQRAIARHQLLRDVRGI